jgi:hypothetical protein
MKTILHQLFKPPARVYLQIFHFRGVEDVSSVIVSIMDAGSVQKLVFQNYGGSSVSIPLFFGIGFYGFSASAWLWIKI